MEFSSRSTRQECGGDADGCGEDDECRPERSGRLLASLLEPSETVCEEDRCEQCKPGIGGRDVVGKARLGRCEEDNDDQGTNCPGTKALCSGRGTAGQVVSQTER